MTLIQPKPFMDKFRLRHHAQGIERRRNMSKIILEKGTPFPKSIEYSDIDEAMYKWVDEKIKIVYDGKRLPTYKLYSTQRLSEYLQSWDKQDDTGNPIINFKTVTRELNPQKGENQGNYFNIPGHKNFAMFYVPVLQENGTEAYDKYTMKQPFSVNFIYTVAIISNKMEIINEMNELMHYEFSAIDCYISPNDHPMPMVIENITDESEYNIDDRKYYSQSYQIKLMAYIIRKEDFKVTKIPSRFTMKIILDETKKKNKKRVADDCWLGKLNNLTVVDKKQKGIENELPKLEYLSAFEVCEKPLDLPAPPVHPNVIVEELPECCLPKEPNPYVNKTMKLIADFPYCEERSVTFTMDTVIDIDTIETKNVHDFVIKINGEVQTFDDEVKLNVGDEVFINITREDEYGDASLTIVGTDPDTVYDSRINYESELDEPVREEDIYVNKKGTE